VIQRVGPVFVVLFFAIGTSISLGQSEVSPMLLRTTGEAQIDSFRLNAKGFREIAGDQVFYLQASPRRYVAIELDGQSHPALDLDQVPPTDAMNPKDLYLIDMTPDPRGGVLGVVRWNETPAKIRTGVVRFDRDGDYDGLVWLDTDLSVTHAVEFNSSGNFLVVGYDEHGKIKVALFDFRGFVVNPAVLSYGEAVAAGSKSAAGQVTPAMERAMREAGTIQMASATDDSVYLLNVQRGRKILRVQSNGKVTEMKLGGPSQDTMPMELVVSPSYLYLGEAILDKGKRVGPLKKFSISVYDRDNGTLDASYEAMTPLGGTFVVASPRDFYFLGTKVPPGGAVNFSLIRAQP